MWKGTFMPRIDSFLKPRVLREILYIAPKPLIFGWSFRDTCFSSVLWSFKKWQNIPKLSTYTHIWEDSFISRTMSWLTTSNLNQVWKTNFQNCFKSEWHYIPEWNLNFEIQVPFETAFDGRDLEEGPIVFHYIFLFSCCS